MATEVKMPQLGLTMEEGTITKWMIAEGDHVKPGEVLAEITTDKLTNEIESEVDGVVLKIVAQIGVDIPVKGVLCVIGSEGEVYKAGEMEESTKTEEVKTEVTPAQNEEPVVATKGNIRIKISPLAKKTANKLGTDYLDLTGTGPGGRIIQKDIIEASNKIVEKVAEQKAEIKVEQKTVSVNVPLMDGDTVEPMTGMRKIVSERMSRSHTEIPNVTQTMKIDVTKLVQFRKELNETRTDRLSINDFVMKATAKALKENKNVLVSFGGDKIIHRAHINLGMAVAIDTGLIVPVIRDADKMSISELSSVAKDLGQRARDGKLNMDEYSGSTLTVSNMGMFGIESFTPIINQPDGAILGVNEIQSELDMDDEGKLFKKQVMRVSMTFDHRLMDGAVAAKFKLSVKKLLENPIDIIL